MSHNALAKAANATIAEDCPVVHDMLSAVGKALFFPRGILTQSAEAKTQAHRYNATIGIATEAGEAMHLPCVHQYFDQLAPNECYPYAPSFGDAELRQAWQDKQRTETPSLGDHAISLPVVSNALTHGLDLIADLFVDQGDDVLIPDQMWGNYRLTFGTMHGGSVRTFPFFTANLDGFNAAAFAEAVAARPGGKLIVVLNFPNNPSGYSPTQAEQQAIIATLTEAAAAGTRLVVICDDAYYGMFFSDDCAAESIFGPLAQAHDNLLAIKVDGATKEMFVWGLRIGFVTYGVRNGTAKVYQALEQKTAGAVRGGISNVTRPGQSMLKNVLQDPDFRPQQAEKIAVLRQRAAETRRVVDLPEYADCWQVYPFNAGYFMCLRLTGVHAEVVRSTLLTEHGVGTISLNDTDLRVAFSCVEADDIADLFHRIAVVVRQLRDS